MSCKTNDIGSIKIRTRGDIIRTLYNIRHVPDLKKKLISLSTLFSNGFKFSTEDEILRISKFSLVVMKRKVDTL